MSDKEQVPVLNYATPPGGRPVNTRLLRVAMGFRIFGMCTMLLGLAIPGIVVVALVLGCLSGVGWWLGPLVDWLGVLPLFFSPVLCIGVSLISLYISFGLRRRAGESLNPEDGPEQASNG